MPTPVYAVIMAGGSGTRFWPASRGHLPKQFLPIGTEQALLAETVQRLEGLVDPSRVIVVTTRAMAPKVRELLPQVPSEQVLAEPSGRNTAPCLALATRFLLERDPDSVQLVLPADHVIRPAQEFRATMRAAAEHAALGDALVVCGIRPTYPATGFGYIEAGEQDGTSEGQPVYEVERFVEKPPLEKAREFLATRKFLWNAGIFVWRSKVIWSEFERWTPKLVKALEKHRDEAALAAAWEKLPAVSIDVAVLERAAHVRMLPIEYFWSDVGSWPALDEVSPRDAQGNVASGGAKLVAKESRDNIVHAEAGQVVALIGVQDLVVVHAGNATLVCPKDQAQRVREIVELLKSEGGEGTPWV